MRRTARELARRGRLGDRARPAEGSAGLIDVVIDVTAWIQGAVDVAPVQYCEVVVAVTCAPNSQLGGQIPGEPHRSAARNPSRPRHRRNRTGCWPPNGDRPAVIEVELVRVVDESRIMAAIAVVGMIARLVGALRSPPWPPSAAAALEARLDRLHAAAAVHAAAGRIARAASGSAGHRQGGRQRGEKPTILLVIGADIAIVFPGRRPISDQFR